MTALTWQGYVTTVSQDALKVWKIVGIEENTHFVKSLLNKHEDVSWNLWRSMERGWAVHCSDVAVQEQSESSDSHRSVSVTSYHFPRREMELGLWSTLPENETLSQVGLHNLVSSQHIGNWYISSFLNLQTWVPQRSLVKGQLPLQGCHTGRS